MRGLRMATLSMALGLGLGLASVAQAQTIGYNVRTGDVWVDNRLGEINDYGYRYRDPFINELNSHYGAPRPLLVDLLERRRWAPADVYYACSMAHVLRVPCQDIVHDYERSPGQGWGVIAKRRGIKPGSPAFHALKRGTVATYDRWGHPVVVDRDVRVDWAKHGPRGGKAKAGANSGSTGKDKGKGHGPGPQTRSAGDDHGKGHGKGNAKAHDAGKGNGKGNAKGKGKDG
jgi:hypothetical protein